MLIEIFLFPFFLLFFSDSNPIEAMHEGLVDVKQRSESSAVRFERVS